MSVFSFTHNPITRVETLAQQKREPSGRLRRVLDRALMVVLSLVSVALVALEMAAAVWRIDINDLTERLTPVLQIYLLLVILQHFRVMFGTLAQGVAALERERRSNERWDTLMMTGITSREVVLGKWWALVRARWRAYAWLALWRAGAALAQGADSGRWLMTARLPVTRELLFPTPMHFALGALLIFALTMMNLPFTTACAVYTGIAYRRLAPVAAFVMRILLIIGAALAIAIVLLGLMTVYPTSYRTTSSSFERITPMFYVSIAGGGAVRALFDNGATMAAYVVSYSVVTTTQAADQVRSLGADWIKGYSSSLSNLLTALLAATSYAVLTAIALLMAQVQAEKFGALKTSEAKGRR